MVDNRYIEGVIANAERAQSAYDKIVSRRVDPGLVARVSNREYRINIFPVRLDRPRIFRLSYVTEYEDQLQIPLPGASVEGSVLIESDNCEIRKISIDGKELGIGVHPLHEIDGSMLELSVRPTKQAVVAEDIGESRTIAFFTSLDFPRTNLPPATRIALIWDASRSRRSSPHPRERAIIESWLAVEPAATVDLYVLRHQQQKTTYPPSARGKLLAELAGLNYDGGLQILPPSERHDYAVFVTDARMSAIDLPRFEKPLFVLSSQANRGLRRVAWDSGGDFLRADGEEPPDDVAKTLGRPPAFVTELYVDDEQILDITPQLPAPVNIASRLFARTKTGRSGEIRAVISNGQTAVASLTPLPLARGLAAVAAGTRIRHMTGDFLWHETQILNLAAEHGLVTQ